MGGGHTHVGFLAWLPTSCVSLASLLPMTVWEQADFDYCGH